MRRCHLLEIIDQPWCPEPIRDAVTDYLQHVIHTMNTYGQITPHLVSALRHTAANQIVDLCSGGGGPWVRLQEEFKRQQIPVEVCLTDLYVNTEALQRIETTDNGIRFHPHPVNAMQMPDELNGFRTLFSSFHHFKPEQAQAILRDAVNSRRGIGIFEATKRHPAALLAILLTPLLVWIVTPRIRPFRWSRLLWTYLIPVVPFVVLFDGIVSCLRTYSPAELAEFTKEFAESGYQWQIGEVKAAGTPLPVTYLIGYPQT